MPGFFKEPSLQGLRVGSPSFFARQKAIIRERPLLKRCYDDWYRLDKLGLATWAR